MTFVAASLIHSGRFIAGYEHHAARVAEAIIAIVLLLGLILTWWRARQAALMAQGFALLGTLVGIFTIIVGVGPRTMPDIVYHMVMVMVLSAGLALAWRMTVGSGVEDAGTSGGSASSRPPVFPPSRLPAFLLLRHIHCHMRRILW